MAGTARHYSDGCIGRCEVVLYLSIGPVPIAFSLEPPMSVVANHIPARAQAGSLMLGRQPSRESMEASGLQKDPGTPPPRVASLVPCLHAYPEGNFLLLITWFEAQAKIILRI